MQSPVKGYPESSQVSEVHGSRLHEPMTLATLAESEIGSRYSTMFQNRTEFRFICTGAASIEVSNIEFNHRINWLSPFRPIDVPSPILFDLVPLTRDGRTFPAQRISGASRPHIRGNSRDATSESALDAMNYRLARNESSVR